MLDAISRALELDRAEHDHLFDLAKAANGSIRPRTRASTATAVPPAIHYMLDAITSAPAILGNNRMDIVAANALGFALYSDMYRGSLASGESLPLIFSTLAPTTSTPTRQAQREC